MKITRSQLKRIISEALEEDQVKLDRWADAETKRQQFIDILETSGIASETMIYDPRHMQFTSRGGAPEGYLERVLNTLDKLPSNPFNGPDAKYKNPGNVNDYFIEKHGEEEFKKVSSKEEWRMPGPRRGEVYYVIPDDHPTKKEWKELYNAYRQAPGDEYYGQDARYATVGFVRLQIKAYNYLKETNPNFQFGSIQGIDGLPTTLRDIELQLDNGTYDPSEWAQRSAGHTKSVLGRSGNPGG